MLGVLSVQNVPFQKETFIAFFKTLCFILLGFLNTTLVKLSIF